jgi:phosphate transporter
LKKLIYLIEKERVANKGHRFSIDLENGGVIPPSEHTALISDNPVEAENSTFVNALNKSLDKIVKFYAKKETELYDEMDELIGDFEYLNQHDAAVGCQLRRLSSVEHGETQPEEIEQQQKQQQQRVRSNTNQLPRRESNVEGDSFLPANIISKNITGTDYAVGGSGSTSELPTHIQPPLSARGPMWPREVMDDVVELRKRTIDLFVLLSELKSFVALNLTAFAKILKKYDKITNSNLKRYYTATYVVRAYPFKSETKSRLNERIQQTERAYALLATGNNLDLAIEELKTHLREHIVWERNTVWKDLIGQERRTQSVGLSEVKPSSVYTPFGTVHIKRDQVMNYLYLVACVVVFVVLMKAEIFNTIEQNRCLSILVFASMLWAGEVKRNRDPFLAL